MHLLACLQEPTQNTQEMVTFAVTEDGRVLTDEYMVTPTSVALCMEADNQSIFSSSYLFGNIL